MSNVQTKEFLKAVETRRTIYALSKEIETSPERIEEIVREAVKHSPSAFNSQSGRAVVLLGEHHDRLWDMTKETLRAIVPADQFEPTEGRMNGFRAAAGTVLFFEDQTVIEGLQQQFASYADNFPIWSQQSSGMLQLVVWTALEAEGLGASLQHYNPLIDAAVQKEWGLPASWKLIAQMPFGKQLAAPNEKQFQSLDERVKLFK